MTILLPSLLVFLFLGVPIAYSLGLSALCYFVVHEPGLIVVMPQRLMAGMDSYALIALPLFIFMGQLMNASGITRRLIDYCMLLVGRFRGGLGLVNVSSSMLFGGISGSSASDTASIGSILIPEMKRRGYPEDFAAGLTVASSTMGMMTSFGGLVFFASRTARSVRSPASASCPEDNLGRRTAAGMTHSCRPAPSPRPRWPPWSTSRRSRLCRAAVVLPAAAGRCGGAKLSSFRRRR